MKNQTVTSIPKQRKTIKVSNKACDKKKKSYFKIRGNADAPKDFPTTHTTKEEARIVVGSSTPLNLKGLSKESKKNMERIISIYNRHAANYANKYSEACSLFLDTISVFFYKATGGDLPLKELSDIIKEKSGEISKMVDAAYEERGEMVVACKKIDDLLRLIKNTDNSVTHVKMFDIDYNSVFDHTIKSMDTQKEIEQFFENIVEKLDALKGENKKEKSEEESAHEEESRKIIDEELISTTPPKSLYDLAKELPAGYVFDQEYAYVQGYWNLGQDSLDALVTLVTKTAMQVIGRAQTPDYPNHPEYQTEKAIVSSLRSNGVEDLAIFIRDSAEAVRKALGTEDSPYKQVHIRFHRDLKHAAVLTIPEQLTKNPCRYRTPLFALKHILCKVISEEFNMVDPALIRKVFRSMPLEGNVLGKVRLNKSLMVNLEELRNMPY